MYHLAIISCPVRLCSASWGFTPADTRSYWAGRDSIHGKIVDHVVMEHTGGVARVLAQIARREEWWWGLEQVGTE